MKILLLILGVVALQNAFTQDWTGAVSSDWNNSANWTSPPTNGASIIIDPLNYTGGAFSPSIISNSVFTISDMLVINGAILTINANLTTSDNVEVIDVNSKIIVNQGIFSVNFSNNGRLIADLGGEITVNGGTVNVGQRLIAGFDAQIIINNGNVTTNERLLMDLGGKVILQNGNVTVGQVMALADGDINGSSYFEQNGGSMNVTGQVALENEAGNYEPTVVINQGTFTLNGDLVWFGAAPGLGTPRVITTGGVFNINGAVSNLPLSTVNMMFNIKDSSVVNFNGASIDQINAADSIKQAGNSLIRLTSAHSWNNNGVFYANGGLVFCNGTTSLLGAGKYVFNNLTVNTSKTLNQAVPNEIFINGDFTNSGTFNASNHKVTLNGVVPQVINGTNAINFSSLKMDNAFGVTLNYPISVSDSLILTSGNLNTSTPNLLTLKSTSSSSTGSSNSFVDGPMKKIGNTPFVFPIGSNTNWRRMGISAPSSVSSEVIAEYFNSSAPNTTIFNSPLSAVSTAEHWFVSKSIPTDNIVLECYWENATQSGITDCAATTIAHYNGTSWDNVNSSASGNCSGNGFGTAVSNSPVNLSGFFTFGYFGNVVSQSITVCNGDSITVGTNNYTTSGNYIDVFVDVTNNDSIVITNLTVLPLLTSSQTIQVCAGETFTVGSATYNASGMYVDTLISLNGCDSIVTTYLTVANVIDVTVSITEITLSANNTGASFYQWLDCNNGYATIPGATSSTYVPVENGNYAVALTVGNCIDTSDCIAVNSVGLSQEDVLNQIKVYPNPGSGITQIQFPTNIHSMIVQLIDITGKLLIDGLSLSATENRLDLSAYPEGIYIIKLHVGEMTKTVRWMKL